MDKNAGSSGGISFIGALAITFIVLKLTGVIDWSWIWVLFPLWMPFAIVVCALVIYVIYKLIKGR
jgi:hypothetical protein